MSDLTQNNNNFANPKNIHFLKYLTKEAHTSYVYNNAFSVFKSINNIFYLIYGNKIQSIICLNLINEQIVNEIKNAHNAEITSLRHYLDVIKSRDLLLSIAANDINIKIWNINNWECLLNLKNIYIRGLLSSAYFLKNNNENYIITCNDGYRNIGLIKAFDFKGNQIKEINDSNDGISFIDIYYDKELLKNFIITGNEGYIKSYDYTNNKIYHKYSDNDNDQGICYSIIIRIDNNIIKLMNSCSKGYIRIWNFHTGNLLNRINVGKKLYGICLWNNEFLFAGSRDHSIKLIDLKDGKIIKELNGHNLEVSTIQKIFHPKYGECLISHGLDSIILWNGKI